MEVECSEMLHWKHCYIHFTDYKVAVKGNKSRMELKISDFHFRQFSVSKYCLKMPFA